MIFYLILFAYLLTVYSFWEDALSVLFDIKFSYTICKLDLTVALKILFVFEDEVHFVA